MVLILRPEQEGLSPLQVDLWDRTDRWVTINPIWGETEIDTPALYIFPSGDFYATIRNPSTDVVAIEKLAFRITVELTNGSTVTYGLQP